MKYLLSKEFTQIAETTGTIQNSSHVGTIEMSTSDTPGSGVLIYPLQKVSFVNKTIYLRCVDGWAQARVVNFVINAGGSSDTQGGGGSSDPTPVDPNSQYLIVDSPFSTDLTDNCGVVWNPAGNVTFSDGAVNFNNSAVCSAGKLTLGGQDFTLNLDVNISQGTDWSGIFGFAASMGTSESGDATSDHIGEISFYTDSSPNVLCFQVNNSNRQVMKADRINKDICDNVWHNIRVVYNHNTPTLKLFIDEQISFTYSLLVERLARNLGIFHGSKAIGSVRNLKLYDGVAILPEE